MSYPGTARDHLNWGVERAMVYAEMGDWTNAWASFGSDMLKHDGTAWITRHALYGMAMFSGVYESPKAFKDFISGWAVSDSDDRITGGTS